jgi:hypothetical protein
LVVSLSWIAVASATADDDKASKPVGPAEAAKLADKKVVLEMEVKSTG